MLYPSIIIHLIGSAPFNCPSEIPSHLLLLIFTCQVQISHKRSTLPTLMKWYCCKTISWLSSNHRWWLKLPSWPPWWLQELWHSKFSVSPMERADWSPFPSCSFPESSYQRSCPHLPLQFCVNYCGLRSGKSSPLHRTTSMWHLRGPPTQHLWPPPHCHQTWFQATTVIYQSFQSLPAIGLGTLS